MQRTGVITMAMRELDQLKVIQAVIERLHQCDTLDVGAVSDEYLDKKFVPRNKVCYYCAAVTKEMAFLL